MSALRFSTKFTTTNIPVGTLFNDNINNITTYIIDGDYTFQAGTYIFNNYILIFEGGSFNSMLNSEVVFILNNCTIEGSGHIFRGDISFGPDNNSNSSRLLNREIKAEWFGALPNQSTDVTDCINKAIEACYATDVHTLSFSSGTFIVGTDIPNTPTDVLIGHETSQADFENTRCWEIRIEGAGKYPLRGTTFLIGTGGHFIVNSRNSSMGTYRGGGIYNCCFKGTQTGTIENPVNASDGIKMLHANTYTVSNCFFMNLKYGMKLSGSCYYADIVGCVFDNCNVGVKSNREDGAGQPNNNTIRGCMFTHCQTNPIDASHCEGWHIIDTDIEGSNGTLKLGSYNRMTNVRM